MQNRNNHHIKQRRKSNKTKVVLKIFMYDLPPEFQISSMKVAYTHSSTPTTTARSHHRSSESFCFLSAVTRPKPNSNPSSPNVLLSISLKVLDKDATGFVFVNELHHILTSIGEKLEPAEFDECIREVDVGSDGKIRYEDSSQEWSPSDECNCFLYFSGVSLFSLFNL
jgi:hypothetical protein